MYQSLKSLPNYLTSTTFYLALILTTFGQSVLRVVITSQVVGFAGWERRGEVLGIMSSIASLSTTLSPFIAVALYEKQAGLPFLSGAAYLGLSFFILLRKKHQLEKENLPEDIIIESQI